MAFFTNQSFTKVHFAKSVKATVHVPRGQIIYHTSPMFRISKQLEISRRIHDCETVEELCQWFKLIVNGIGVQEASKFTANAF